MEELVLTPFDKKLGPAPWHLQLLPDRASLVSPEGGPPLEIPRDRTEEMLHVAGFGGQTVLLVKGPRKSFRFKLAPEQRQQLDTWLGPPTYARLRSRLKHRFASSFLMGLVLMLLAVPIFFGDFDPVLFALGFGLLALAALVRFRPRPQLLLFDAFWMTLVSLNIVYGVWTGARSVYMLVFTVLLLPAISISVKDYRRFRDMRPEEEVPLDLRRAG
jgi:hypothetical protein